MDKLRIGVIVDDHDLPTAGGGFSYYRTLLNAINRYNWNKDIEIVNIVFDKRILQQKTLQQRTLLISKNYIYSARYLYYKILYTVAFKTGRLRHRKTLERTALQIAKLRNTNTEKALAVNKIDLAYYLKPEENTVNYPFIATHWDVGHRSMHAFPEVALDGNYEVRENYYTQILNKAFLIICESESGAKELAQFYAINPAKIKIMPMFSGDVVRLEVLEAAQQETLKKYGLEKDQFFLYPAQFWAHKNHYNLLQAFGSLLQETGNEKLRIMLCGSDKGNLNYIQEQISFLKLDNRVVLPGYIPDEELHVFYKNAIALVMPTFLGPTNIPLLEAAELHCPVLCSDLEGHREILQEAALYFDPASAAEIKQCMQQILHNDPLQKKMTAAATLRIATSSFSIDKSLQLLEKALLQARPIRKTWGFVHALLLHVMAGSLLSAW